MLYQHGKLACYTILKSFVAKFTINFAGLLAALTAAAHTRLPGHKLSGPGIHTRPCADDVSGVLHAICPSHRGKSHIRPDGRRWHAPCNTGLTQHQPKPEQTKMQTITTRATRLTEQ